MAYRDKLLALLNRWEKERGASLPCPSDRDARTIVGWIRMAMTEADSSQLELAQQHLGRLGCHLAKAEQELRDVTRDRDRWRNRAHEADALVRSIGVQALRTNIQFNHHIPNSAGNRSR